MFDLGMYDGFPYSPALKMDSFKTKNKIVIKTFLNIYSNFVQNCSVAKCSLKFEPIRVRGRERETQAAKTLIHKVPFDWVDGSCCRPMGREPRYLSYLGECCDIF